MPSQSPERDALVAAAVAGDLGALGRLADQLRPQLLAGATALLRFHRADKVDPADAVQQGLLAAHKGFPTFKGRTAAEFDTWMTKIVRREALDMVRYWHTRGRDIHQEMAQEAKGDVLANLPDDSSTASAKLDRKERVQRLLAFVEQLPMDEREVVRMRHLEGCPASEISRRLGCPPNVVASLLKQGIRHLIGMWRAAEVESSDQR